MDYYCGVWKEIKKINIFIDALTKITNNTKKINFLMLIIRNRMEYLFLVKWTIPINSNYTRYTGCF